MTNICIARFDGTLRLSRASLRRRR